MERKIGYAVVGLGVGKAHVDAAANSKHGKLVAVCDLIPEKLQAMAEKYPGVLTYESFDEMLKNPDIEIVSIALPSAMHAEFAVRAMEAGKNVLVEKPVDITPEAAQKIEDARIRTGKKAAVVHQNRNNVCMKPMKDAIDSGRIGKLIMGTFEVKWYRTQEYYDNGGWRGTWEMDGGGSLMNQAVHTVDLMQWLMGDVESVTSVMGICNHKIETEDMTTSIIRFKNGAVATFVSTTCAYPGICTTLKVYGANGSMEANDGNLTLWKFMDAKENEEAEMLEKYNRNNGAVANDPTIVLGHASIVENMIDAVYYDRDPQILPSEGIKAVKIINAIYESARTGKTVTID
ncbi:MAG: Gfo/Idh/MocA family protein [Candidatus Merdivicinus sp.]|jgi:UDP-N-acetyl-2-amino-2-deoxyglucuronate dehydrogenase